MTKFYLWPLTACLLLACQPDNPDVITDDTQIEEVVESVEAPKIDMFAPTANPGDSSEARVILGGQGCDAYDTVTVNDHNCSSAGESCLDNLIFVDGDHMRFNKSE